MTFKEFLAASKEVMTEVNGLLKVTISTVGLIFVVYNVYKQVSAIKEVTPTTVIETVCGGEVIDSLGIASKLADPATGAIIEELLAECQKIKPPEPIEPAKVEPDQVQFPIPIFASAPIDIPDKSIANVPIGKQLAARTSNDQQ